MVDGPRMANGRTIIRNEQGFGVPGPAPTITVAQLIVALQDFPADMPVRCWTPGQRWDLGLPFMNGPVVLLEGNAE